MQPMWNYTKLADAYVQRPDYSATAIDEMCRLMAVKPDDAVCDIGAGAGHLTIELGTRGFHVKAVEPNDAMRKHGIERTRELDNVSWFKGTGEQTNQVENLFDAVTFGSSFNVCDQKIALDESRRICKSGGWFACMWNHRDLLDPIQKNIENIIKLNIPNYDYGLRRQDQTPILEASGLFEVIKFVEGRVLHQQSIEECVEAWRSHGTLHRQANEDDQLFNKIISDIETYLLSLNTKTISIPYITRIWVAKFIKK